MTTQCPEILAVDMESISFSNWELYGVSVGDIDKPQEAKNYPFESTADESKITPCTALWRGYVSAYRLRSNGTLVLEHLEYPFTFGSAPDQVDEILRGDFWLELRSWFMGDSMRVPFRDGKVDADKRNWRSTPGLPIPRRLLRPR